MKFRTEKKNYILYGTLFLLIFLFLLYIFVHDKANNIRSQQSAYAIIKWEDYQIRENTAQTTVSGTIQITDTIGNIFAFYSLHQNVTLYVDESLFYQYPVTNNNPLSASPGYCWNFIELPKGIHTIRIIFSSPYASYLKNIPIFYVGNAISIPAYIVSSNLLQLLSCVVLFVMGIIFIAYHLVISKNTGTKGKLLKLGIFSIFLSIWSVNECDVIALIMKNNIVTSYVSFLTLMLLPFPFAIFIKTFYGDSSGIWDKFCYLNIVQIFLCFLMQITGICDFRGSLWTTHAIICILAFIIFIQSYKMLKSGILSRMSKLHLLCICICVIFLFMDMIAYYRNAYNSNRFGRIGFLFYVMIMGMASTLESAILIKKGQEAGVFQKLAYTDQMTGLNNRTCFNIDFEMWSQSPHDIAVIDFDLNNLKHTNDTLGHSAGDRYIKNCATIIYEIFNGIGKCYRVGGDEFVTIIEHCSTIDLQKYLSMLESSVDAANRKDREIRMQIAYGCAKYSPDIDKDLEDTYNRADKIMYKDKKAKKEIKRW